MLILTRRVGETIMIGSDVEFTVLGVKGAQIRVGVKAPKNVTVHREEIYARIRRQARETSAGQAAARKELETEVSESDPEVNEPH